MNINDLRRERAAAESQIARLIAEFHEKTGLHITDVRIESTWIRTNMMSPESIVGQRVEVRIEPI